MHPVHIFELGADGVYLAEAVHGFLEHDSDLFPAQLPQRSGAACEQVGFVEPDVPGGFTGFFRSRRRKALIIVDLPEPDSPMMPRLSPASMLKETRSTARTCLCLP